MGLKVRWSYGIPTPIPEKWGIHFRLWQPNSGAEQLLRIKADLHTTSQTKTLFLHLTFQLWRIGPELILKLPYAKLHSKASS